jgi:hypothetical protein
MYKINYYSADGHEGTNPPAPAGQKFATLQDARLAVIVAHGYHGEYENEDRNVCLHESAVEGCGGFEIATQETAR